MYRYMHKMMASIVSLEKIEIQEVHAEQIKAQFFGYVLFKGLKLLL